MCKPSIQALPLTLALLAAMALAACDPKPVKPAPPLGEPGPPKAEDAPVDGGAEQDATEPLPPGPGEPIQPDTPPAPSPATFDHAPAGQLPSGQGSGYLDRTVWAPAMCWPLQATGFANSQVYGPGGGKAAAGKPSQCDSLNYSLPWRDNFCELRSRASPLCASGSGHQGQDIRPATCKKNEHWAVATEAGEITDIGTYTVTLIASAAPHYTYRYLHLQMASLAVQEGAIVTAGQKLGKVSNDFGGTPTTIHLHFEMRAGLAGLTSDGTPVALQTFLPPYLSLAEAYQRKLNGGTCG